MKNEFETAPHQPDSSPDEIEQPKDTVGNKSELELRKFTKDYSPIARAELSQKIKIANIRNELGIISKKERQINVRALKDDFATRFTAQKSQFEKESQSIRDVEAISKEKKLIFVQDFKRRA